MALQTELAVFERAAETKGKLLRVEGDRPGPTPRQLVLTFDVGRILIRPGGDGLSATRVEDRSALPEGLVALDEEEPWWRLLGSPLARVWAPEGGLAGGVCLQFRADDRAPRIVSLWAQGASVSVRLENPPG